MNKNPDKSSSRGGQKRASKVFPRGDLEGATGRKGGQCGDCNTCGKCDELEQAEEMQGFNEAVFAAAAIERDSFEKNLSRQRRATLAQDAAKGGQQETFRRNAVARPAMPAREGALLSHDGLTLYTLIVYLQRVRPWFYKNRLQSVFCDGKNGGNISVGRNNYLVPWLHYPHFDIGAKWDR